MIPPENQPSPRSPWVTFPMRTLVTFPNQATGGTGVVVAEQRAMSTPSMMRPMTLSRPSRSVAAVMLRAKMLPSVNSRRRFETNEIVSGE